MPTQTSNYGFYLPLVNDPTDEDQWGGLLNSNFSLLDTLLKTATDNVKNVQTASYNTALTDRNKVILADATSGTLTVTLLAPATAGDGFTMMVKKTDSSSNAVTLSGTIESAVSFTRQYDTVVLISDGTTWRVISQTTKQGLSTRTYYASGSGNFVVPAGVTKVRITGAAGGGAGGTYNSAGTDGGNTTIDTCTANGGKAGLYSLTVEDHGTASGGDINIKGGGGSGGVPGTISNPQSGFISYKPGGNGGLFIKDLTVTPGANVAYSVGAGGTAAAASSPGSASGAGTAGYAIFEYAV